jgi:hypothetical protein
MENYLEGLFGVGVCKLKLAIESNGDWYARYIREPLPVRGLVHKTLEFETNKRLKEYRYGSILITSYQDLGGGVFSYTAACIVGKETKELIASLL